MSRERRADEISALSEMTVLKQMQRGASMAAYQPPRSKFMITDILGASGKLQSEGGSDDRTPSPQPRDLSVFLNAMPDNDDDSDCDSSKCWKDEIADGHCLGTAFKPIHKSLRIVNGSDL